jgi:hypothetical protein
LPLGEFSRDAKTDIRERDWYAKKFAAIKAEFHDDQNAKYFARKHTCANFVMISTVEKKFISFAILSSKTQAFDWFRYFHFATE